MQSNDNGSPRRHFSYANVTSTLAVFLAIAGGTALAAALPKDSVRSKHVKDNALKSADLKDGKAVTGADVTDGSLQGADVADGSLTGADVANDSLTGAKVDESALGLVGRYAFEGSCDPETTTFIPCSFAQFNVPQTGRVLVIATVQWGNETAGENSAHGQCRLYTESGPIAASTQSLILNEALDQPGADFEFGDEEASLVAVTDVLAPGNHIVGLECNQTAPGATVYRQARVVAAVLSAG